MSFYFNNVQGHLFLCGLYIEKQKNDLNRLINSLLGDQISVMILQPISNTICLEK